MVMSPDRDIKYWELTPDTRTVRLYPALKDWKMVVYND